MTDFLPERVNDLCADAGPCPHSQWRPEVVAFANLMERQLRANDHKPGWTGENPWPLLDRLYEEANELRDELQPGSRTDALAWRVRLGAEAADVANFAMMIADVCGALPSSERLMVAPSMPSFDDLSDDQRSQVQNLYWGNHSTSEDLWSSWRSVVGDVTTRGRPDEAIRNIEAEIKAAASGGMLGRTHDVWDRAERSGLRIALGIVRKHITPDGAERVHGQVSQPIRDEQ